jgi:hypothetical protein
MKCLVGMVLRNMYMYDTRSCLATVSRTLKLDSPHVQNQQSLALSICPRRLCLYGAVPKEVRWRGRCFVTLRTHAMKQVRTLTCLWVQGGCKTVSRGSDQNNVAFVGRVTSALPASSAPPITSHVICRLHRARRSGDAICVRSNIRSEPKIAYGCTLPLVIQK